MMSPIAMKSALLLLSVAFLLGATLCSARHVISINSSEVLELSSLAWDPTSTHFVVGSAQGPVVYGIPDNGVVRCLVSEPASNNSNNSVAGVFVDQTRGRLIVAFSNPSSIAAYDLKSYRKIYALPLPELGDAVGGITVDSDTGDVLVSAARRGVVLKVKPEGDTKKVISEMKISDNRGLGGIAYLSHGYILALEPVDGKLFKLDTVAGTVQEVVVPEDRSKPLAPCGHAIARYTDKSVVIAANRSVLLAASDDGTWTRAGVSSFGTKLGDGEIAVAVATREVENVLYVLVKSKQGQGYRIEVDQKATLSGPRLWCLLAILFLMGLLYSIFFTLCMFKDYGMI